MVLTVLSIEYLYQTNDYVYDLETEDGTFAASSSIEHNDILCKNTDSCYVSFDISKDPYTDTNGHFDETEYMKEHFKISKECANKVSGTFKHPIKLEFEKIMYPFFLYAKKRYAYKEWTVPEKPGHVEFKGLSVVRRDFCPFVKETSKTVFSILMKDKHVYDQLGLDITLDPTKTIEASVSYLRTEITKLLIDKTVDIKDLCLSKSLKNQYKLKGVHVKWTEGICSACMEPKKSAQIVCKGCLRCTQEDFGIKKFLTVANKTPAGPLAGQASKKACSECQNAFVMIKSPHVRIANNLRSIDPINGPKPPDRVPFVYTYVDNWINKNQYEFCVSPSQIKSNNEINTLYYFLHQLKNSVDQIYTVILPDTGKIYNDILVSCTNNQNKQSILNFKPRSDDDDDDDDDEDPRGA